jgi:hypothetical protein
MFVKIMDILKSALVFIIIITVARTFFLNSTTDNEKVNNKNESEWIYEEDNNYFLDGMTDQKAINDSKSKPKAWSLVIGSEPTRKYVLIESDHKPCNNNKSYDIEFTSDDDKTSRLPLRCNYGSYLVSFDENDGNDFLKVLKAKEITVIPYSYNQGQLEQDIWDSMRFHSSNNPIKPIREWNKEALEKAIGNKKYPILFAIEKSMETSNLSMNECVNQIKLLKKEDPSILLNRPLMNNNKTLSGKLYYKDHVVLYSCTNEKIFLLTYRYI